MDAPRIIAHAVPIEALINDVYSLAWAGTYARIGSLPRASVFTVRYMNQLLIRFQEGPPLRYNPHRPVHEISASPSGLLLPPAPLHETPCASALASACYSQGYSFRVHTAADIDVFPV